MGRARGPGDLGLAIRAAALNAALVAPAVIAAYIGARWGWVVTLGVTGAAVGAVFAAHYHRKQSDRLRQAIDGWRKGRPFDLPDLIDLPIPTYRLAIALKRATLTLSRQEYQLDAAIRQQELAMQEIHHRVKNNLQVVASLLNLQASRIRVPEARAEFQSARDRVRALATLHRHLYAHGEIHTIDMREFLMELCNQLFTAMGEVIGARLQLSVEAPALKMSSDQAVPLALIVTEAVSNALKYAFPAGRTGHVSVTLQSDGATATLDVCDDGVGIPIGRTQTESGVRDGLGIQLIRGFARQLHATLLVEELIGTRYVVTMPLRAARFDSPDLGGPETLDLP